MSISDLDSFIKTMKKLIEHPLLDQLIEEEDGFKTIRSSSSHFIQNVDDDRLMDDLIEIEASAGHFLFDNVGLIKPSVTSVLKKNGLELIRLSEEHRPFTHAIKTEKFSILVSD